MAGKLDMKAVEARLQALAAEYRERAAKIGLDIREGLPADAEERATQLENADVLDALGREAVVEGARVEAALARLQAGTYGRCVDCGEAIEVGRLQAYPAAARCTDCKEAAEPASP